MLPSSAGRLRRVIVVTAMLREECEEGVIPRIRVIGG
jgi:hypothetical protein